MGYRIDYQPIKKMRGINKRISRIAALSGMWFLLFLFLVHVAWPDGAEVLKHTLWGEGWSVTVSALDMLAADLQTGLSIHDVFSQFIEQMQDIIGNVQN